MKRLIVRQLLIVRLAALALITLFLMQTNVNAQQMNGYVVLFPSVGLVPGQRLRLTLFNPNGEPVRAQVRIHNSGGIQVGLGDGSVRFVQQGVSQSFDINYSDIPFPGEEGTDRIQLRASFYLGIAQPATIEKLTVAMETISISDGTSNTVFVSEIIPSAQVGGGGNDVLLGGAGRDVLLGLVPGQTVRVTLINPPSLDPEQQQGSVNTLVKVFDGSGGLLIDSDRAIIPPESFRSFDFNRDSLGTRGERGTHRQQVRIKPFYEFTSRRLSSVLASFEIVDNRTGQTKVLQGQECLVFFLGGIPE